MAEPKKETVRSALPQGSEITPGLQNEGAKHDLARIPLPSRTPVIPTRRSPPSIIQPSPVSAGIPVVSSHRPPVLPSKVTASPVLHPPSKPAGATPVSSEVGTTANLLSPADAPAASENFAGVSVQPGPKKETGRITILSKPAPVSVAPSNATDSFDSIPRSFCWGLLGISALTFLIQIWNYALS